MTDAAAIPPEEGPDLLAAEYVLGLLEGTELVAAEARLEADAGFAAAVDRWSERFAPMLDAAAAAPPPPALWTLVERRIDALGGATDDVPIDIAMVRLRRRGALWRGYGVAATAVAAVLVGAIALRPTVTVMQRPAAAQVVSVPTQPRAMVATLSGTAGVGAMMASFDPAQRSLTFAPGTMSAAKAGRAHELWIIPAGGSPRSLGVIAAAPGRLTVAPELAAVMDEQATLAVSIEPAGGSPTGAPTGPVIAAGKFTLV